MVSTHLKNSRQIGSCPQVGVKIKNACNHHLVKYTAPKTNSSTLKTGGNERQLAGFQWRYMLVSRRVSCMANQPTHPNIPPSEIRVWYPDLLRETNKLIGLIVKPASGRGELGSTRKWILTGLLCRLPQFFPGLSWWLLVGGFSPPSWKICEPSNWESFPQVEVKMNNYSKPPPRLPSQSLT